MNSFGRWSCLLLVAVLLFTGCSSKWARQASQIAGEEAAFATLQGALISRNITSADHIVDAIRLVVAKQDYAAGAAALAVALNEHNLRSTEKITSSQVINLIRQALPTVKRASPRVATYAANFCNYVESKK